MVTFYSLYCIEILHSANGYTIRKFYKWIDIIWVEFDIVSCFAKKYSNRLEETREDDIRSN